MATMKMTKTEEEWSKVFLNDPQTKQQSLVFIKRMMAVAVSYITYLRGIFPEKAYRTKYLEDLSIKVLRENTNNRGVDKIVKWMMGCFDALEKHYLEIVFIGVYTNPDEPNRIIESYTFKIKYTEKGPEMAMLRNKGPEMLVPQGETKCATVLLIRKIFLLMQNLEVLPDNVYLTMQLYYYDDITPADYQPPGFKEGEDDSMLFEGSAVHVKVGEVQTGFHTLGLGVSLDQGHIEKLQQGNHVVETTEVSERIPAKRPVLKKPCEKISDDDALPSEDESAQFKKAKGPVVKRRAAAQCLSRKKRRA